MNEDNSGSRSTDMRKFTLGCVAATLIATMSVAQARQVSTKPETVQNTGLSAIGKKDCSVGGSGYINANHRYRAPLSGRTGTWRMSGGKLHINYDNGTYGWGQIGVI